MFDNVDPSAVQPKMYSRFSESSPKTDPPQLRGGIPLSPILTLDVITDLIARYRAYIKDHPAEFKTDLELYLRRLDYLASAAEKSVSIYSTCTTSQMLALRAMLRSRLTLSDRVELDSAWEDHVSEVLRYASSLDNGRFRQLFRPGHAQCQTRMLFWHEGDEYLSPGSEIFRLLNPSAGLSKACEEELLELYREERKPEHFFRGSAGFYGGDRFSQWLPIVCKIHEESTPQEVDLDEVLNCVLKVACIRISGLPEDGGMQSHLDLVLSVALNLGEKQLRFLEWEKWTHGPLGSTGLVDFGRTAPVIENELFDEGFRLFGASWFSNAISDIYEFVPDPDGPSGIGYLPRMNEGENIKFAIENGIWGNAQPDYRPGPKPAPLPDPIYKLQPKKETMSTDSSRNRIDIPQARRAQTNEIAQIQAVLDNEVPVEAQGGGSDIIQALFWDKSVGAWGDALFPNFLFETFFVYAGKDLAYVRLKVSQIFRGHNRRYDMTLGFEALDILRIETVRFPMSPIGCVPVGVTITFNKHLTAKRFIAEPIATRNQENDLSLNAFTFYVGSHQGAQKIMGLLEVWAKKSQEEYFESEEASYRLNPPDFDEFPESPGSTVRD